MIEWRWIKEVGTDVNLFDAEMKYLYDNGFKVLTMSDLGYDENSKYLYIKIKSSFMQGQ